MVWIERISKQKTERANGKCQPVVEKKNNQAVMSKLRVIIC